MNWFVFLFTSDNYIWTMPWENVSLGVSTQSGQGQRLKTFFMLSSAEHEIFFMLINLKLLTIPNFFLLNRTEHENFPANKSENANFYWHFHIY